MANAPLILIVDDDLRMLAVLQTGLEELGGFSVATASDGERGLELFHSIHPAAVIIDVKMPGLDGYQLARAIRGDPATTNTPLVFLTAMAQDYDRFTGLAAGADIYLVKPVAPSELVERLHQALRLTDAAREQQFLRLADEAEHNA
jgi:DNA-binding response OmpR family regulator